jgi:hypothetical protein
MIIRANGIRILVDDSEETLSNQQIVDALRKAASQLLEQKQTGANNGRQQRNF